MSEHLQLAVYLIALACGTLILIFIDVWLRLRRVKDPALVWIYLSWLSWVVAISAELLFVEKGSRLDQAQVKYFFSIFSSVLWVVTAFRLARVREVFSPRNHTILRWTLFALVLGISLIAWILLVAGLSRLAVAIDVVASSIAGITLGWGLSYSFYRYGNRFLVGLTAVTFAIFIMKQIHYGANYLNGLGRPTAGFFVWFYLADMDLLIMISIALAVAWALSESSRLKPVAESRRVQVIALFFDLRGSTQWAHEIAERDFNYVRDFLDELREWATNRASSEPQGRPNLIKFLGDGFLFVWEIPDDSVVDNSNAIVQLAYDLCVDYRSWVKEERFTHRFAWGVPIGIGYGVDVGQAIRLTFENGSDDYLGAPLNIAAKMQDLARPSGGGVIQAKVWSRLLKEHLRDRFPKEGAMKIGDRRVDIRMTEEVERKNHRPKK